MNRLAYRETSPPDSVPRASGDEPMQLQLGGMGQLCSPRERG